MLKRKYGLVFALCFALVYIPFIQNYGLGLIKEDSVDFPSFYYGAKLAFVEHKSPYVEKNLKEIFQEYTENNGDYFPYLYSPPSLVFFLPFTALSYRDARLAMLVLNHLMVLFFIYVLLRKIIKTNFVSVFSTVFVVYIFLFTPLRVTLDVGQVNIIVLSLICLSWWMAKEDGHPFQAALPLSLAIILKLYPILFLIPLFLEKKYKTLEYVILIMIVIPVAVSFVLPEATWETWYANVGSKGYKPDILNLTINTPANQSMFGFFLRMFFGKNVRFAPIWIVPKWFSTAVPYIASGVVLAISLMVSFFVNHSKSPLSISQMDMDFSLWSMVTFLIAPVSWDHHLIFIVPAMAVWIYSLLHMNGKQRFLVLGISVAAALVLAFPYPYNSPDFRVGFRTLLISVPLYIVGLLWLQFVLFLMVEVRRKATSTQVDYSKKET